MSPMGIVSDELMRVERIKLALEAGTGPQAGSGNGQIAVRAPSNQWGTRLVASAWSFQALGEGSPARGGRSGTKHVRGRGRGSRTRPFGG